jgi:hypothetical protein
LVLLVFALPDKLGVEGGVAGVEEGLGGFFVVGDEVAEFFGGDVGALGGVAVGGDRFGSGRGSLL